MKITKQALEMLGFKPERVQDLLKHSSVRWVQVIHGVEFIIRSSHISQRYSMFVHDIPTRQQNSTIMRDVSQIVKGIFEIGQIVGKKQAKRQLKDWLESEIEDLK